MVKKKKVPSPLGKVLRFYREKAEMGRVQLAEAVNKSPQFIAALEVDKMKTPSVQTLRDIVRALGLSLGKRHRLMDAALGLDCGSANSSRIPYDVANLAPLLTNIVESGCEITADEVSWLIDLQSRFSSVMSADFIQSVLQERRGVVASS